MNAPTQAPSKERVQMTVLCQYCKTRAMETSLRVSFDVSNETWDDLVMHLALTASEGDKTHQARAFADFMPGIIRYVESLRAAHEPPDDVSPALDYADAIAERRAAQPQAAPSSKPKVSDVDLFALIKAYNAGSVTHGFVPDVLLCLQELSNRRAWDRASQPPLPVSLAELRERAADSPGGATVEILAEDVRQLMRAAQPPGPWRMVITDPPIADDRVVFVYTGEAYSSEYAHDVNAADHYLWMEIPTIPSRPTKGDGQ